MTTASCSYINFKFRIFEENNGFPCSPNSYLSRTIAIHWPWIISMRFDELFLNLIKHLLAVVHVRRGEVSQCQ